MREATVYTILILMLTAGCGTKDADQAEAPDDRELTARQELLKKNIEFRLRDQLDGRPINVGAIEDSDLPGFDKATFNVGPQQINVLLSEDDKHVLLLAAEPFENLSDDEMAAILAEESKREAESASDRSASFARELERAPKRGNEAAKVTIVEFSDFQCPYCRRGFDTMEELLSKHGDRVRLAYMHFPLPSHPWARPSALAAVCAGQQGDDAFWMLHDFYFRNQQAIRVDNVVQKSRDELAGSGIDLAAWETCATDENSDTHQAALATIDAQVNLGRESGVTGTPGFFVNGAFINGARPLEVFERAIEEAEERL